MLLLTQTNSFKAAMTILTIKIIIPLLKNMILKSYCIHAHTYTHTTDSKEYQKNFFTQRMPT